ncbi:single-stranded-DNA-specific exonuclease RecJ [Fumia xinanensis]|uniref:Single-stranded-DNA-specific exonuclease RecJ n=1 Tax=Fumia xinanensis TaxID=2763659 RepID=A0A926E2Q9_9FIRM|nr:single-stranded-DNA-specific exonuclease RecJ [Fumia xinanensis]MBC8559147.1 single-stranded-DNA-specific exonuclease RecJ [Fumia xinanensis]
MLFSKWRLPRFDVRESRLIQAEYGVSPMIADILAARKLPPVEIAELLDDDFSLEDPMLLPDMEKAVERINQAVDAGEKIAVYGDYDCDGVTATVILVTFLQSMGADVFYYIPERLDEGYGLNAAALDEIKDKGASLVITVDNGISAIKEVEYALAIGLSVVVTDHHQVGAALPAAAAVVNPHRKDYPGDFRELCGAGVALKLCAALDGGDYEQVLESFGALAAVGTVGDIVPLRAENRFLVKKGMEQLPYTENLGLQALMEVSGLKDKPLNAQKIAFGIVPRINAAGRMGSAKLAAELLLCEDEERALQLAREVDALNVSRRNEEDEILLKVQEQLKASPEMLLDRVLVVASEGLNHGVVGIVSSRLINLYGKPNIILSVEGDTATGSARSLGFFSLYQALSACSGLLQKYGGHKAAAGMTINTADIGEFQKEINRYAREFHDKMPAAEQVIDKELHIGDINVDDVQALELLEPCGEGNPQPVFLLRRCVIEAIQPLGGDKHLKLKVNFEGKSIYVLYFRMSTDQFIYPVGSRVDILANLELNEFRDKVSIAVKLRDIRPTGFDDEKMQNADHFYQKIRREEPVERKILAISVPTADELRATYKIIRQLSGREMHMDLLYLRAFAGKINYCKYRLMLDILSELSLVSVAPDFSSVKLCEGAGKVNLEDSAILRGLQDGLNT